MKLLNVKKGGESYTFQCYLVLWDECGYCVFLYTGWRNVQAECRCNVAISVLCDLINMD